MNAGTSVSARYFLLPQNHLSPSLHVSSDQRMFFKQKIELLQMENEDLRKREQNLKRINVSLLEALGNRQQQPEDIKRLLKDIFECRGNQETSQFIKQLRSQDVQTDNVEPIVSYPALFQYNSRRSNPQINLNFNSTKDCFKKQFEQNNQNYNLFEKTENFESRLNKVKFNQTQNLSFTQYLNAQCQTPSMRGKRTLSTKKLMKKIVSPIQAPPTGRSEVSSYYARNVATDLLCDICGLSFSPMQFLSHVQQCQGSHQNYQEQQYYGVTDTDFSEQQQDNQNQQLVEMLESRKKKLTVQIQKLKKLQSSPDRKRRLQTDLDQIVFIIKNKKTLNTSDIKRLLEQKKYYEKCFR